jgi:hypothetical protein
MKELLISDPLLYSPPKSNILESTRISNGGNILLKDVLVITAEEENGNGRLYPIELWEREISKFQQKIKNSTTECIGELDHPDSSVINLRNGSHIVRKLNWEGKRVLADIEILCDAGPKGNEAGRILGSYLLNGLAIGFSTRGMGSLKEENGRMKVQDDFDFVTIDAVSNPSNQGSWGVLREGIDMNNKIDKYYNINKIITQILCSNGSCPII